MEVLGHYVLFVRIFSATCVIVLYSLAAYWNIRFLLKTEWNGYRSMLKVNTVIICFGFLGVFLYTLATLAITGTPVEISDFGALIIRPFVIYNGAILAAGSRFAINLLEHGGGQWILKSKKS